VRIQSLLRLRQNWRGIAGKTKGGKGQVKESGSGRGRGKKSGRERKG